MDDPLPRIVAFLRGIGLRVNERTIGGPAFLPGILIERGGLAFDPARLVHPGDLLHEAGHLAVVPSGERERMDGEIASDGGQEMAAIAWSWAALLHLGMAPSVLFHETGYRGQSSALIENFSGGCFIGVPMLEWRGMAYHMAPGVPEGAPRYPAMRRWLCP